jgi:hypothetical protein
VGRDRAGRPARLRPAVPWRRHPSDVLVGAALG